MKLKLAIQSLLTTVALSAALPLAAVAESSPSASMKQYSSYSNTTQFRCVRTDEGHPATVATRGSRQSPPMIVWKTDSFGPQYTPERRCQIVTDRLNNVLQFYDGKLQGLQITHGMVDDGQTVLCVIRFYGDSCTRQNMLLTLKPKNASRASAMVSRIQRFARGDSSVEPIEESGGERVYADLSEMLEPYLGPEDSSSGSSYEDDSEEDFQGW